MPTVKYVEKSIWDCEEFDVKIKDMRGHDLRGDMKNFPTYPCTRKTKGTLNVARWKKNKFAQYYPGCKVSVLDGSGNAVINGHTLLSTVRSTYH